MKLNEAMILAEEVSDEKTHFTSDENLIRILKSGYLKGSQYDVNKRHASGDKDYSFDEKREPKELCVVRKTVNFNPDTLSGNSGRNRFLLDFDNIKNIRNVKKPYSIAEVPIQSIGFINREIKELEDEYDVDMSFTKELLNKRPMLTPAELEEKLFNRHKSEHIRLKLKSIIEDYKYLYRRTINREGEERLDLTNAYKNGIPVSSKYMKIELSKTILNNKEIYKLVRKIYKNDPELFVKNDTFKQIIDFKKEVLKKEKNNTNS